MKILKEIRQKILLPVMLLGVSSAALAANGSTDFVNDYASNTIFLFADNPGGNPGLQFTDLALADGFSDWTVETLTPALAIFTGAAAAPGAGSFRLDYRYRGRNVSFQWAEVLFDTVSPVILGAGTAAFTRVRGGGFWSGTNTFSDPNRRFVSDYFSTVSPAAVPLPDSVVLLLSAGAVMGFSRRSGPLRAQEPA